MVVTRTTTPYRDAPAAGPFVAEQYLAYGLVDSLWWLQMIYGLGGMILLLFFDTTLSHVTSCENSGMIASSTAQYSLGQYTEELRQG